MTGRGDKREKRKVTRYTYVYDRHDKGTNSSLPRFKAYEELGKGIGGDPELEIPTRIEAF